MKSSKLLMAIMLVVVTTLFLPALAYADKNNPLICVDDLDDDSDDYFEYPGETVRIRAYAGENFVPYEIRVFRSQRGQSYGVPYTGPWIFVKSITVTSSGWFEENYADISTPGQTWWIAQIYKNGAPYTACGTYFVIPQVPLGVAMVLTACFAGLGVKRLQRTKKETL